MAEPWTEDENASTVDAYLEMLNQELTHQPYVKKRYNDEVVRRTGRSAGAVEYKFQNISAVLLSMRTPFIDGYKPALNYQSSLEKEVRARLLGNMSLIERMRSAMSAPAARRADLEWNVGPRPTVELAAAWRHSSVPRVTATDFVQLEAMNSQLGLAGERAIVEFERRRLESAGCAQLATRIRHVSVEEGDGLGYDIASFEASGQPRWIEVKTTRRGIDWPMFISRNEVEVSRQWPDQYQLYRVYSFASTKPGLYQLPGAIPDTCDLDPQSYAGLPRLDVASVTK